MSVPASHDADLDQLIGLFYASRSELGEFDQVASDELPEGFLKLLAHEHHMTVTVEAFFDQRVDVEVLEAHRDGDFYWRKILLRGVREKRVVQFGIVRLKLGFLAPEICDVIELGSIPLGRVLIEHGVLREVELLRLWHIRMASGLQRMLETDSAVTFGRTALIHFDGQPAVELLEIVTPDWHRGD